MSAGAATGLSAHVVAFCRLLREEGIGLGPAEQADALRALALTLDQPHRLRTALRAAIAKSREEQAIFDRCFAAFWADPALAAKASPAPEPDANIEVVIDRLPDAGSRRSIELAAASAPEPDEEIPTAAYSPQQVLTQTDFALIDADQIEQISQLLDAIGRRLAKALSRRYQADRKGRRLDLRRTLRAGLRSDELLDIALLRRRRRRLKLALICDVSKSMDVYSRFLIQFMFAFQRAYRRIETFVFSTGLHRVTEQLRAPDLARALDSLAETVPDWSGGTRIGESLRAYLDHHGRAALDQRTVVAILSDGWDTGDIDLLAAAMEEIQQRSALVIWLNPLLGSASYRPETRGMLAALPFIDLFAAAHNVASLRQLGAVLGPASTGRPVPRATPAAPASAWLSSTVPR